ncbi:sialate O-acetylesterase [Hymenobacter terrenus]|uniref:sialate O-acetylesterase n=1 Tax=Hymenobacter terrenus TaxID=1629124 RepID=UPI000619A33C|nr:sialate O-acetylesterase [Hymenobacter terrenus]
MFRKVILALVLALALAAPAAHATVRLPQLVGSHMVLQRDKPLPIWGWAAPGEKVSVTFRDKTYAATAPDADGRWQATLPATPAGGPYTLTIKGENTLVLEDVLLGDVWLAAGQSNMEFPVKDLPTGYFQPVVNADQEIAAANFPKIRLFKISQAMAYHPASDVKSTGWLVCSPATVAQFSAVAYFFGRDIFQRYQVPIGLISSCWGGTSAEAWTSAEGLRALPDFSTRAADVAQRTTKLTDDDQAFRQRQRAALTSQKIDKGYPPGGKAWAAADFDASAWPEMALPSYWETTPALKGYDGVVWFRKEIDLPVAAAGQPLTLSLGRINDTDSTWFNGVKVGSTDGYNKDRRYAVPAALVRAGRNVVAVRVVDLGSNGGISGEPATLSLTGPGRTLSLAGSWHYQVGLDPKDWPVSPFPGGAQNTPTVLFNSMVAPLIPFALKGVIWYQGENNTGRAEQYRTLFPALITDWRKRWGAPELPFLFVQLANFLPAVPEPGPSTWAELREAQAQALVLPRTGMATAIDIGETDDIHPHNKQEVGRRLALAARHIVYGEKALVHSGPTYAGMAAKGAEVRLRFKHVGGGLVAPNGKLLQGFAVAGADQKFHWATARLMGNEVMVQSADVKTPVAVRYNWANNPNGNLYNKDGLPAVPFRTDSWPGITVGVK